MSIYLDAYDDMREVCVDHIKRTFNNEHTQALIIEAINKLANDKKVGYLVNDKDIISNCLWADEFTEMIGKPFYFTKSGFQKGLYFYKKEEE